MFDISTLCTSIPLPVGLEVINRKLTDHISQEGIQDFLEHSLHNPKLITLLELVLNNCMFSFQQKFYKQLQGAPLGSPVSPVMANICMEYFEESVLGHLCTIPTPWWKRYVDDVICSVKKDQVEIPFNHINQMNAHIKFMVKSPDSEGSIPFLDTKCSPNSNNTIHTTVYRKPTQTDRYLDWNSDHPRSTNRFSQSGTNTQGKNGMFHSRIISQGDGPPSQGSVQEQLSRCVPEKNPSTVPQALGLK